MSYVIVAVVAFLAGCEWMILMHSRAKRRFEDQAAHSDGYQEGRTDGQ